MDADYARNLDEASAPISTFRHSLFVLATVMSTPNRNIAVVDAGLKALAVDSGMPTIWKRPDIRYLSASDEHGKLDVASETTPPKLGEKMRLVPGHCDPTVDRYDWYVGVRGRRVECLWPIAASGGMH
jgi:D-serine deaminase-like pyridoxal phosphate-dependent protein